jgi:Uma2 family endonuclease
VTPTKPYRQGAKDAKRFEARGCDMADRILEELRSLPSDARVEVANGQIVEMSPVGGTHHFICGNIHDLLKTYVKQHNTGFVFMHGLIFYLERHGNRLTQARVAGVSFVATDNVPGDWDIDRLFPDAPTLAVEVFSPNDDEEELLAKTREYLRAGTEQVWLIYPRQREVHQYKRGESLVQTYSGATTLAADDLFPGLSLPLADIFALPDLSR